MLQVDYRGHSFQFEETPTINSMTDEIFSDNYGVFDHIYQPGDVILDIGANEGVFSVIMAKLHPETIIYSFEPVPKTYHTFVANLKLNHITNVHPSMIGIAGTNRTDEMVVCKTYSGGSSLTCTYIPEDHEKVAVDLRTLDYVWDLWTLRRVRLVKMDIEGAEYEALLHTTVLPYIDYMVMEIHENDQLRKRGHTAQALVDYLRKNNVNGYCTLCEMAE